VCIACRSLLVVLLGLKDVVSNDHISLHIFVNFLATDQEARVQFSTLSEKKSSGSGTGSTQPREYN
jgi:hypothetical protein